MRRNPLRRCNVERRRRNPNHISETVLTATGRPHGIAPAFMAMIMLNIEIPKLPTVQAEFLIHAVGALRATPLLDNIAAVLAATMF